MSGDVLVLPELFSKGYGQISKMIMCDTRLTCEAKCIYSLLASFSGAGNAPYPSVEYQCRTLHLGENRYYKHRRFLTAFGYLVIKQTHAGTRFASNRYELSFRPEIDAGELRKLREEWGDKLDQFIDPDAVRAILVAAAGAAERPQESPPRSPSLQNEGAESPRSAPSLQNEGTESPRSAPYLHFACTENEGTINNSLIKSKPDQPASLAPQVEAGGAPAAGGAAGEPEPEGFAELAATWPKPVGARERPECAEAYGRALAEGRTPRQVAEAAERYLRAYRAEHPGGEIRYVKRLKDWLVRQDGLMFYGKRPARRPLRRPEAPEREECADMERQAEMAGLLRDVAAARARGSAAALGAASERLAAALAAPGGGPAGREGKE